MYKNENLHSSEITPNNEQKSPTYSYNSEGRLQKPQYIRTLIITHLASQTYVWHSRKWNFARLQIYLQPAKSKRQHFGLS